MKFQVLRQFAASETGAVTVDWIVICAAAVGLALTTVVVTQDSVEALANDVSSSLSSASTETPNTTEYWLRVMSDDAQSWNNIEWRTNQMAQASDGTLMQWYAVNGLEYFNAAMDSGDNRVCEGCNGAGNRLDLMLMILQESENRGIATDDMRNAYTDAASRYDAVYG